MPPGSVQKRTRAGAWFRWRTACEKAVFPIAADERDLEFAFYCVFAIRQTPVSSLFDPRTLLAFHDVFSVGVEQFRTARFFEADNHANPVDWAARRYRPSLGGVTLIVVGYLASAQRARHFALPLHELTQINVREAIGTDEVARSLAW